MIDLTKFRATDRLIWNRWTVFEPGGGSADGTLYAGDQDTEGLPLDVFIPDELDIDGVPEILPSGVRMLPYNPLAGVIIVAEPASLAELHETVRAWCRDQLGRDDVEFTVGVVGEFVPVERDGA